MSYYYIVNALSHIGDSLDNVNEVFFADNISSFSNGICENSQVRFKSLGKKHIFCVVDSTDRSGKIYNLMKNILSSKGQGKERVKFQYDLKEMMDNLFSKEDTQGASFLYCEGKNIFASGYNDVFVYKYSKSTGKSQRIVFPTVSESLLSDEEPISQSYSKYVGTLASKDEYLVLGRQAFTLLGEKRILEIFESNRADVCQKLGENLLAGNPSGSYSIIHVKVKKSARLLVAWLLSFLGMAAILLLIFLL